MTSEIGKLPKSEVAALAHARYLEGLLDGRKESEMERYVFEKLSESHPTLVGKTMAKWANESCPHTPALGELK